MMILRLPETRLLRRPTTRRAPSLRDPKLLPPRRSKNLLLLLAFQLKAQVPSPPSNRVDLPETKEAAEEETEAVVVPEAASGVKPVEMLVAVAEEDNSTRDLALPSRPMLRVTKFLMRLPREDLEAREETTEVAMVPSMRATTEEMALVRLDAVAERVTDLLEKKRPRRRSLRKKPRRRPSPRRRSLSLNTRRSFLVKISMTTSVPSRPLVVRSKLEPSRR